ncbi:polysaccharide biosynthesis/export family protein [Aromatoleum sp.]|uniref:polysaccharide biosynthesis/export family protein n=1 Tax=Aromatoleum sp. TaxID=2307007 RepID=UPI002FCB4316
MPNRPAAATVPAPVPAQAAVPQLEAEPQRQVDYSANLASDVFGANLFAGTFAREGAIQFNPDYLITTGDRIQVRLWGAYTFDDVLVVDPQGNVFLPHVGPVKVLGVANKDLQRVVEAAARRVFRANVSSYASLAAAQPVRVFVGGFVNRAGLYNGTSMDSLLHYLDQAGGIDPERGSFLHVQVKRGERVRATVNLYDFLLAGRIPLLQLADGDVIFVPPRQNTALVSGLADNSKRFEFAAPQLAVSDLARLAKPKAQATHVRVVRNTGTVRNVEYYALAESNGVTIGNGDEVEFTADKKPGTITVRVEGEHQSAQEYVLPYGARIGDLVGRIEFSERSETQSIQLFRRSVRERQKAMLATALKSLESTVLTARSGTSDEARLRKEEAELILQWVERAKTIEPTGQVLIAQATDRDTLLLENGDILKIPTRDGLVLVNGEVMFPNAIAFDQQLALDDYIGKAGGYTQSADNSRVVVAHRDGSFDRGGEAASLRAGDEVLVLPKVEVKSRQIWKDMTQIIYQIAVSAKVVFGL